MSLVWKYLSKQPVQSGNSDQVTISNYFQLSIILTLQAGQVGESQLSSWVGP